MANKMSGYPFDGDPVKSDPVADEIRADLARELERVRDLRASIEAQADMILEHAKEQIRVNMDIVSTACKLRGIVYAQELLDHQD